MLYCLIGTIIRPATQKLLFQKSKKIFPIKSPLTKEAAKIYCKSIPQKKKKKKMEMPKL